MYGLQVEWQDLKDYFKSCGEVLRADVFKYADGRSRVRALFLALHVSLAYDYFQSKNAARSRLLQCSSPEKFVTLVLTFVVCVCVMC